MKTSAFLARVCAVLGCIAFAINPAFAERQIPSALKDWQDWATWDARHRNCPTPFNDAGKHICFWPGEMSLTATQKSAQWEMAVEVFDKTWVPLPGGETWPFDVRANNAAVVVVERNKQPCIELAPGRHKIAGEFRWEGEMPQLVRVPREVGVLALSLDGRRVEIPNWDDAGNLWLKRVRIEATDKDAVTAQIWRVLEDGIPLWLRTEIELSVSGKSREEELGSVVPEGWSIASVEAPVPVAVDDQGRMKAQVRAGKWIIRVDAFRTMDAGEVRFAPGQIPVTATELVGFRASPEFRMAELEGLQLVDVSQTTFPKKWRNLPGYQWQTGKPFRLVEKMRGMGLQKPKGLEINRVLWLDEDGQALTFRDQIRGELQQIWRLDIAEGQKLGAAKILGQSQLITTNPANGALGVEIRTRNLDIQALGRSGRVATIPATGWRLPVDRLSVTLNLPPGWRLFALFGADWVHGDWLSAWTLLDLFLLLIFSLTVFKLWGLKAGLLALLAFGLAYHEPDAPRLTWLFLLVPLALLRVVPEGGLRRWLGGLRLLAIAALLLWLVPFVAQQLQSVIHPQLEPERHCYGSEGDMSAAAAITGGGVRTAMNDTRLFPDFGGEKRMFAVAEEARFQQEARLQALEKQALELSKVASNMAYDAKAKIQTGPAEPEWNWNWVSCGWNGPVAADETIRPILISATLHRVLTVLRVALLLVLGGILLRRREHTPASRGPGGVPAAAAAMVGLLLLLMPGRASAQLPDKETLNTLRDRLLEVSDAYPQAAEIPSVELQLTDGGISMSAEVHAALKVAVPLPGKLPSWSPVSVKVDGVPESVLCRSDGYLWVVVPAGVHRVSVEGLLPTATEWEWTFLLKPRRVAITAPGWAVTGVRPNGVPENQVFFARQRKAAEGEAEYDRKDFNAILALNRHLEIGLLWQVRNVVTRLSSAGKAISLRVPLLAGEKVLTSGVIAEGGFVEVRMGAGQQEFTWESELPVGAAIALAAAKTDRWVESWHLVTSPVWNASLAGLAPVFETIAQDLVPVWHPWPGESVALTFGKPEAVSGDTLTVRRVKHEVFLGSRQRTSKLALNVEASIGDDFILELDPAAEISSLKQGDRALPVRRDGAKLIIPVHPGSQTLNLEWCSNEALKTVAVADRVKLPVEAANITTVMHVPESRWVLWAGGPLRGPAVRFWSVLAASLLAAWLLGGARLSPLNRLQWALLALGLTQVHFAAGMIVIGWFFLVAWRGKNAGGLSRWKFRLLQILLFGLTFAALGILVAAVMEGLLGSPEMFILGNGSWHTFLRWFEPRCGNELPLPVVVSVSVWFYRLLMLGWALWLAAALIRWLKWTWVQFSEGGCWKRSAEAPTTPPSLPQTNA